MKFLNKKLLFLLTIFAIFLFSCPFTTYARNLTYAFELENDFIITVELSENSTLARSTLKTGSKTYTCSNNEGSVLWTYTVHGTFYYNGKTASCTASSDTYTIFDSPWKVESHSSSKSGNTATGTITLNKVYLFVPTSSLTQTITLFCSPEGTLY